MAGRRGPAWFFFPSCRCQLQLWTSADLSVCLRSLWFSIQSVSFSNFIRSTEIDSNGPICLPAFNLVLNSVGCFFKFHSFDRNWRFVIPHSIGSCVLSVFSCFGATQSSKLCKISGGENSCIARLTMTHRKCVCARFLVESESHGADRVRILKIG